MKLPYQFTLGRRDYSIAPIDAQYCTGMFFSSARHIDVAVKFRGRQRKPKDIAETFWHETTHAILRDMNSPLWKDETFVTAFSKRLTQVIYTARFS